MHRYYCPNEDVLLTEEEVVYIQRPSLSREITCARCGKIAVVIAEDGHHNESRHMEPRTTDREGISLIVYFAITIAIVPKSGHRSSFPHE